MATKFYAVAKGRHPGIYSSWEEANRQVSGFPGNCHQSFKTLDEAQEFMTSTRRAFRELGIKTTCNPITHPDAGDVPPSATLRRRNGPNGADGDGDNSQFTEEKGNAKQGNRSRLPWHKGKGRKGSGDAGATSTSLTISLQNSFAHTRTSRV